MNSKIKQLSENLKVSEDRQHELEQVIDKANLSNESLNKQIKALEGKLKLIEKAEKVSDLYCSSGYFVSPVYSNDCFDNCSTLKSEFEELNSARGLSYPQMFLSLEALPTLSDVPEMFFRLVIDM